MKKNISYRDKLLELASIYKINDIKLYIKNKKYLTTAQIEHILKKNKVPIPNEFNKSIIEIHKKKITTPFFNIGSFFIETLKSSEKEFFKIVKNINNRSISLLNSILGFFSWINKTTINILNSAYNFKVEEQKANKFVSSSVIFVSLILVVITGIKFKDHFLAKKSLQINLNIEKKEPIKDEPKKETVKKPEKKEPIKVEPKKETVKKPEKKEPIKVEPKKETVKKPEKKNSIKEFVLPDLNLKTETVLTLFKDVDYDLSKVRKNKLVKPIYFTQFPKDLDEITSVKLKKETFIKIVLPLVVAENQKIMDDRQKFNKIVSKKMTTDKEKSWLRQKFKEYKIKNGSVSELNKRMDIIPVSIALAQAAKESGWGTSRFALEGNAIFGQWTWSGSGIAPLDRSKEKSHKILKFPILRASVKAYKNNLNTHKSYKSFREKRNELRKKNKPIEGKQLIHTLNSYAQTGIEYTKILAKMMDQNSLEDFENVRLTGSADRKQLDL
jgi:Bax protein